jgi:hypothetical protein
LFFSAPQLKRDPLGSTATICESLSSLRSRLSRRASDQRGGQSTPSLISRTRHLFLLRGSLIPHRPSSNVLQLDIQRRCAKQVLRGRSSWNSLSIPSGELSLVRFASLRVHTIHLQHPLATRQTRAGLQLAGCVVGQYEC